MRINAVDNTQSKSSFKARLSIVGDQTLLSKEQLGEDTNYLKSLVEMGIWSCLGLQDVQVVRQINT